MSDWKYDPEDLGEDADDDDDALEPGSPTLENSIFVLLGVLTVLFVFVRIAMLVVGG